MKKLQLNESQTFITTPSGMLITPSKLEIGKTYLHGNHYFLRTVTEFAENNTYVYYTQFNRVGYCSKQHFARLCPNEATQEEIEFLETYHDKQDLIRSLI